jgi:hypothetical protein
MIANTIPITTITTISIRKSFSNPSINENKPYIMWPVPSIISEQLANKTKDTKMPIDFESNFDKMDSRRMFKLEDNFDLIFDCNFTILDNLIDF